MAVRMIKTITEKLQHYEGLEDNTGTCMPTVQTSLNSHMAWGSKVSPFFLNCGRLLLLSTSNTASLREAEPEEPRRMPRKGTSNPSSS
jgi:hypothetical protein